MNELEFDKSYGGDCFTPTEKRIAKEVWIECQKETEPLRREVTALRNTVQRLTPCVSLQYRGVLTDEANRILDDTQATALAYERKVKAKAIDDTLAKKNAGWCDGDIRAHKE